MSTVITLGPAFTTATAMTIGVRACRTVLATHDLDVAEGLLSRAIYLKDGRIVGSDTDSRSLADRYRRAIHG